MESILQIFHFNGIENEPSIWMTIGALFLASVLSLIITRVYQITFSGEHYSQAFVHSMIMMSMIVSVLMHVISRDVGVALALFAVISLVRFRSAVTNMKDIAYIFFALSVGMMAGLFQFELAICLTIFASTMFYLLHRIGYGAGKTTQILKVTVPENLNTENLFDDILKEKTIHYKLRKVETTNLGTMILYTFAIRSKLKTKDTDLLNEIRERNANLKVSLSYTEKEES